MVPAPTHRACRLEVLADRLSLLERVDVGGSAEKETALFQTLLARHPELGDRVAREVVAETLDAWPCCVAGLEKLAEELVQLRFGEPYLATDLELRQVRSLLDEDQILAGRIAQWGHRRGDVYSAPHGLALLHDPILPALDEDLAEVLEEPLAEVHLHLGGAAPPITFWLPLVLGLLNFHTAGAMAADGTRQEKRDPRPLDELRDVWIHRLLEAAVLRYFLAAELPKLTGEGTRHPFSRIHGLKGPQEAPAREPADLVEQFRAILDAIGYVHGKEAQGVHPCRIALDPGAEIPYRDPLGQAVERSLGLGPKVESPALGERYLIASALRYLRGWPAERLPTEAAVFRGRLLRYLRIKHTLLRLLVHYPGVHGLDRFRQRFARRGRGSRLAGGRRAQEVWLAASIRYQMRRTVLRWLAASTRRPILAQRPPANSRLEEAARLLTATGAPLERRLEIRFSADAGRLHNVNFMAVLKGLHDALNLLEEPGIQDSSAPRASSVPKLQAGVVFHLQKREWMKSEDYAEIMNRLLLWLDDHPTWRPLVLGMDVAAPELDAPPSRFAHAYDLLTQRRRQGSRNLDGIPLRLGKTFHVGEDFRDLLTGVRQVAFAIGLLGLEAGDRLGHALAVGLEPRDWYARRGRSYPRLGDHLLDLLWARRALRKETESVGVDYTQSLKSLDRRLLALEVQSISDVADMVDQWLDDLNENPRNRTLAPEELFQHRLVRKAGLDGDPTAMVDVPPDDEWVRVVRTMQNLVAHRIDRVGLHVEANPTSNLLIAGLADFNELPLFRLHPVSEPSPDRPPRVLLSISTDDPEIFRVNLREEYAALFKAVLARGSHGRTDVLRWIDRLRRDGWVSSFLTNDSPRGEGLLRYLGFLVDAPNRKKSPSNPP